MASLPSSSNRGQKSADLKRRAQEIDGQEAERLVKAIMIKFPSTAIKAATYLSDLGYTMEQNAVDVQLKSKKKLSDEQRVGKPKINSKSEVPDGADPADVIDFRWESVGAIPVPVMIEKILAVIESGSLSAVNLRAYCKTLGRGGSKFEIIKLFELCTGCDGDLDLSGQLRLWSGLKLYLSRQCAARGRRCRDVNLLTLNLEAEGVYRKLLEDGKLILYQRFTGSRRLLALQDDITTETFDKIVIKANWSEARAHLVFPAEANLAPVKLLDLFPQTMDHIVESHRAEFHGHMQQMVQLSILAPSTGKQKAIEETPRPVQPPMIIASSSPVASRTKDDEDDPEPVSDAADNLVKSLDQLLEAEVTAEVTAPSTPTKINIDESAEQVPSDEEE